ncbi:MAG: hypothetical protein MI919_20725 [Holophagales bacterium]|nr:hypothetical protein [Holophagales bacterium]
MKPPNRFSPLRRAARASDTLLMGLLIGLSAAPSSAQLGPVGNRLVTAAHLPSVPFEERAYLGVALATGDFDGNGLDDLALGATGMDVGSADGAGQVVVIYSAGSGADLDPAVWHQNIPGVGDVAESGDRFGESLAAGDFNGDGKDDLAIGVPQERFGVHSKAGLVHVIYGGANGLEGDTEQPLNRVIVGGSLEADALFGAVLATGDFDGDGHDDLAIGTPGETVNNAPTAGAVIVVYGDTSGLQPGSAQRWTQWHLGSVHGQDTAEGFDAFGWSLASGDFDGDSYDDLAVGAAELAYGGALRPGAVSVIYGHVAGLRASNNQFLVAAPVFLQAESNFGAALAAGDFNGDGADELVVGIPEFDHLVDNVVEESAGLVYVIPAVPFDGLQPQLHFQLDQSSVGDTVKAWESFGEAFSVGDFDCDSIPDLVISSSKAFGPVLDAGAIGVIAGSGGPDFFEPVGRIFHQDTPGFVDQAEFGDSFGHSAAAGTFGGGCDSLAVGVPYEALGEYGWAGAVHLIRSGGLFTDGFESGDLDAWSYHTP